jgi:hypothetical protein
MLPILLLFTTILHVIARPTVIGQTARMIEKEAKHLKIEFPIIQKIIEKLSPQSKSSITHPAPHFEMEGYNLRLSDTFRQTHSRGNPSSSFKKNRLVTEIGDAVFIDSDIVRKWEYGESRILSSNDYVKMKEAIRQSDEHHWSVFKDVENKLYVKVTKHKGLKNEKDILVVEEITNLKPKFFSPLRPKIIASVSETEPKLSPIELDSPWHEKVLDTLLGNRLPTIKSYTAPRFKTFGDEYHLRLSDQFYRSHTLGKPLKSYSQKRLVKDIGPVEFWDGEMLKKWEYGESRILRSNGYVKMKEPTRLSIDHPWSEFKDVDNMINIKVRKIPGGKNTNGEREDDVYLAEEITGIFKKVPNNLPLGGS